MKKTLMCLSVVVIFLFAGLLLYDKISTTPAFAVISSAVAPASGQVTCVGTVGAIFTANTSLTAVPSELILVPITVSSTVWVSPVSLGVTVGSMTSAGLPLSTAGVSSMKVNLHPGEQWYCGVGSGSSVVLGYTVH
jgi:hypothetical protein